MATRDGTSYLQPQKKDPLHDQRKSMQLSPLFRIL